MQTLRRWRWGEHVTSSDIQNCWFSTWCSIRKIKSDLCAARASPILSTTVQVKAIKAASQAHPHGKLRATVASMIDSGSALWCSCGSSQTQLDARSQTGETFLLSAGCFAVTAFIIVSEKTTRLPQLIHILPVSSQSIRDSFIVQGMSANQLMQNCPEVFTRPSIKTS